MPIRVQTPDGVIEFPDDTKPAEIDQILGAAPTPVASHDAGPKKERTWTDTATDLLPMAGGVVGSIVGAAGGPPGMIAGAALGGAGGEGWRQVINHARGADAPSTPADAAMGIGKAGAIEGATQAVGGVIGKGMEKGGRALYRGLLKPSKAIRDGFGGADVVDTLIKEGASISEKGLDKVTGKLGESRAAALDLVKRAAPTSTFVDPAEIMGEFKPVVSELRKRAAIGQPNELAKVGARGKAIMKTLNTGVDASGAQTLKETAQDAASGAYRALERGNVKQLAADDMLDEAVARGFRKSVEKRVPGVAAQNANTQRLIGATRAMEDAVGRTSNNMAIGPRDLIAAGTGGALAGAAGAGAGAGAGLLMRLLMSPRAGSNLAILMDRSGKMTPQALRGLRALMSSHEDQ